MEFSKREKYFGFENLANLILKNKKSNIALIYHKDRRLDLKFKRFYKENNGLDKTHPAYDEYNVIELTLNDKLFAFGPFHLTYHNMPKEVLIDGELSFDLYEFINYRDDIKEDKVVIKLIPSEYGLIEGDSSYDGSLNTGTLLDDDLALKDINKEYKDLVIEAFKDVALGKEIDETIITNNMLRLATEFKNRINDLNDGSFIVIDLLPDYNNTKATFKDGVFKFSKGDLALVDDKNSDNLLDIGATYYKNGDYELSFPYYLVASLFQNDQAISNLGYSFMYGRGCEVNFSLALACFKIAASYKNVDACYKLATIYRYNEEYKNLDEARRYFLLALEALKGVHLLNYPSLAYNLAKEKLDGGLFEYDLEGSFLLLNLALKGYELSIKDGFKLHQKQFDEVKELLASDLFNKVSDKVDASLALTYDFSTKPLLKIIDKRLDLFKIGDEVYTNTYYGPEIDLPAGSEGKIIDFNDVKEAVVSFEGLEKGIIFSLTDIIKK